MGSPQSSRLTSLGSATSAPLRTTPMSSSRLGASSTPATLASTAASTRSLPRMAAPSAACLPTEAASRHSSAESQKKRSTSPSESWPGSSGASCATCKATSSAVVAAWRTLASSLCTAASAGPSGPARSLFRSPSRRNFHAAVEESSANRWSNHWATSSPCCGVRSQKMCCRSRRSASTTLGAPTTAAATRISRTALPRRRSVTA
mmetsp:Transcript_68639/g.200871  ORF Transcript_68639/g.200871 Transcript_68639/m.200871 type:complete len:205 (+) Transcript_68639:122-736(+)